MHLHGWFSALAEANFGSFRMSKVGGGYTRVTATAEDYGDGDNYNWIDKVYVGQVIDGSGRDFSTWSGFLPTPEPPPESIAPPISDTKCHKCGHEVKERELFLTKYVGCMC